MKVYELIDKENSTKWEIYKVSENTYKLKYYEYYDSIGWKFVLEDDDNYSREIIEDEFNIFNCVTFLLLIFTPCTIRKFY